MIFPSALPGDLHLPFVQTSISGELSGMSCVAVPDGRFSGCVQTEPGSLCLCEAEWCRGSPCHRRPRAAGLVCCVGARAPPCGQAAVAGLELAAEGHRVWPPTRWACARTLTQLQACAEVFSCEFFISHEFLPLLFMFGCSPAPLFLCHFSTCFLELCNYRYRFPALLAYPHQKNPFFLQQPPFHQRQVAIQAHLSWLPLTHL